MTVNNNLYNIAHRGARSLAPENTMPAFKKAWQIGAHGVETDVSVTSDGSLVLLHDPHLSRTTNIAHIYPKRRKDKLHTFTFEEIQKLDAESWFYQTDPFGTIKNKTVPLTEQRSTTKIAIPLLEELLLFVKEKSWFVNIEIKPLPKENSTFPVVEKVLSLLDSVQLAPSMFSISSFNHFFIRKVQELNPDIEINALIGKNIFMPQNWGKYEFAIYNANADLIDSAQIKKALKNNRRINLYNVTNVKDMECFLKAGVKKIITDFPQRLAQLKLQNP
jgi:glycerophosphoryl diester phosphodiesterase